MDLQHLRKQARVHERRGDWLEQQLKRHSYRSLLMAAGELGVAVAVNDSADRRLLKDEQIRRLVEALQTAPEPEQDAAAAAGVQRRMYGMQFPHSFCV